MRETSGKVDASYLLVDRVNGQPLTPPQAIWVQDLQLPIGVRCRLAGFESGRWIGLPGDVVAAEGIGPTQAAWQFQHFFVATSAQAPPDLAAQRPSRR